MIKHILVLVCACGILYGAHNIMGIYISDIGDTHFIVQQHTLLGGMLFFIYGMTYLVYRISPLHTGFVFIGLLLAKMIIASSFIYKEGLLEDIAMPIQRYVFLGFYLIYLIVLLVVSVQLLNRIDTLKK